MGWLRAVGSFKLYVSFAEYRLFYRALLQKRPIILRSLLIVAIPCVFREEVATGDSWIRSSSRVYMSCTCRGDKYYFWFRRGGERGRVPSQACEGIHESIHEARGDESPPRFMNGGGDSSPLATSESRFMNRGGDSRGWVDSWIACDRGFRRGGYNK